MIDPSRLYHSHKANRVAVISIDLQYLFQNFYKFTLQSKFYYKQFNQECAQALADFRRLGLPIFHVAYDITLPCNIEHLYKDELAELDEHCRLYNYNKQDLCVDKNAPDKLKTDLLHAVQDGETLFLKAEVSAFKNDDEFHHHLQARNIDTVLFMGIYTSQCVRKSMIDAGRLDYHVIGLGDLMESGRPEKDAETRLQINRNLFDVSNSGFEICSSTEVISTLTEMPGIKRVARPALTR